MPCLMKKAAAEKTEKNKEAAGKFRKASAYYRHGKSLALPEQSNLYLYLCQGKTGANRDLCPGNPLGNTCGDLSFAWGRVLDEAIEAVRKAVREFKYPVYDEDKKTGLVRHILVRHSLSEDQVLAVLVTASPVLAGAKAFGKRVRQLCPKITTFIQNINERSTSAVLGYKEKILYGKGYIRDTLCGIQFRISGSSFYQINPVQTEILYRTAIEAAEAGQESDRTGRLLRGRDHWSFCCFQGEKGDRRGTE